MFQWKNYPFSIILYIFHYVWIVDLKISFIILGNSQENCARLNEINKINIKR
jgi:hypothetical protein